MTRWAVIVGVVVLVGVALDWRRRRLDRRNAPTLTADWQAFIASNPVIPPANVPPVRELKAQTVDRFARFRQRCGR
jgi:hypothetical protein